MLCSLVGLLFWHMHSRRIAWNLSDDKLDHDCVVSVFQVEEGGSCSMWAHWWLLRREIRQWCSYAACVPHKLPGLYSPSWGHENRVVQFCFTGEFFTQHSHTQYAITKEISASAIGYVDFIPCMLSLNGKHMPTIEINSI